MKVFDVLRDESPNNTLCTFSVYLPKIGLTMRDLKLIDGVKGEFIGMPSRARQNGEQKEFYSIIEWEKPKMMEFCRQIKPLVKKELECS